MAIDGHQPRRSETHTKSASEAAPESAARPSRVRLPYYRPPTPKPSVARGIRGRILSEAALEGAPTGAILEERPRDAAVASFGNPIVFEVVIGTDDRVKVSQPDMGRNPFRQICALRITAKNGERYVGTGWFVGPRAVATAGHCVYLHNAGGWPAAIDVIPAMFGSVEPFERLGATRFRAVDGWVDQKRQDLDYGIILLDDTTPGDRVGWFEVGDEPDATLTGAVASISGYPADKDQATFQYFHARPLSSVTATRLEYDVDTFGGQSGSPIWLETNGGVVAVGVHTNGASSGNSGTRISEPVIDNFLAWRDE